MNETIHGEFLGPCPICGHGLIRAKGYLIDETTGEIHAAHDPTAEQLRELRDRYRRGTS